MARPDEGNSRRPERVVILDADDPMVEVHGRIVWQEEHDRVVEETWQAAYAEGYDAGLRDAAAPTPQSVRVEIRRRRPLVRRVKTLIMVVGILVLLLMLPLVIQNALR